VNKFKIFSSYSFVFTLGYLGGIFFNFSEEGKVSNTPNIILNNTVNEKQILVKDVKVETAIIEKKTSTIISKPKQKMENIIVQNKTSNFDLFKNYLLQSEFKSALHIYQNDINNDELDMFQRHLFSHMTNLVKKNESKALQLINLFLEIEYDQPKALYLKSHILFKNGKLKKAISSLLVLTDLYVDENFEKEVIRTLDEYTSKYSKVLRQRSDQKGLIDLYTLILEQNSSNVKYIYLLAFEYFELNSFDESKELLEQIVYDDTYKNKVEELLSLINKKINLSQRFTRKIVLEKKGTHFYITALLNNQKEVKLLLDTGASITLIDDSIINSLEHNTIDTEVRLNTAGGIITAKKIQLNSFAINDNEVDKINIISSPMNNGGFDGLLGMNYFKQFDFYIDQKSAILYLSPK